MSTDTDTLLDTSNYLTSFPPSLPADVPRTNPNGSGLPTTALMDWEQYTANWYKNTVVSLDTRLDEVKSVTDQNTADIQHEVIARTDADDAIAADVETLTTTVNDNTAQLEVVSESVNGIAVQFGVTGYIDGVSGGFVFQGVKQLNGTVAYNTIFNSNVTINGNLVVSGTINTAQVTAQAINVPYLAQQGGSQSYGSDGNWHDLVSVGIAGGSGYYAFISGIAAVALYQSTGNTSYGRVRIYSDAQGDLTGPIWANYGQVDSGGNPGAINAYLSNALIRILTGISSSDTIRLQINNTRTGGGGGVFWTSSQTVLSVEVRKR